MAKRPPGEDSAASSKRFRAVIDESVDDLLCPITQALPLDPVFADDGKVYERTAIEQWLTQQKRSPVTNLPMETRLVSATQIKTLIERMVKSDALPEEKVREWKNRLKQQEAVETARRAADAGDPAAALQMGRWLHSGDMGLAKDEAKAFGYFEKAAEAGDPIAMGRLCRAYFYGTGVKKSKVVALRWAAAAAALGNGSGMLALASLYRFGAPEFPIDMRQAFKWAVRAEAAGVCNSLVLEELGSMCAQGLGTAVDLAMAEAMMRKAIKKNSDAQSVERARAWLTSHGLALVVAPSI